MSYAVFNELGLEEVKPATMSLQLVDGSIKQLMGIIEDILVKVGSFIYLVDFVVLEMEEEPKYPLILGRPFLATTKAQINITQDKLHLHFQSKTLSFIVYADHEL